MSSGTQLLDLLVDSVCVKCEGCLLDFAFVTEIMFALPYGRRRHCIVLIFNEGPRTSHRRSMSVF